MADDSAQERSELPTARRLTQARDDGQVPRSPELSAAVVVLCGFTALAFVGGQSIGHGMQGYLRDTIGALTMQPLTELGATTLLRDTARTTLTAMAPFLLAVAVPALLVNAIQARGVLSLKPLMPDFSRVSPAAGLKRLLGVQSIFVLLKSLAKVGIIGSVGWLALRDAWPKIVSLSGTDAINVLVVTRDTTMRLVVLCGLAFLAISLVDYGVSLWQHQTKLKMTRQEIVQEFRESEGDPVRKSRMRSLAQGLTRRRMLHRVKEADVIIVNPTSIAVAIRYDGVAPAPIVLAMGRRKLAERILILARAANVPVVQNIPVARALIATATIGRPIPPALYAAVAEVLAFVYRQYGRLPRMLAERATA